jgi:predicted nucleic acid-binding protein
VSGHAGLVLDAGAFIAVERGNPDVIRLLDRVQRSGARMLTSAGVVAQVWRGGKDRQVPMAYLLKRTTVVDLDEPSAKLLGLLLAATGTSDPVDAHIVALARKHGWPVLSSDPDDLQRIDKAVEVQVV